MTDCTSKANKLTNNNNEFLPLYGVRGRFTFQHPLKAPIIIHVQTLALPSCEGVIAETTTFLNV